MDIISPKNQPANTNIYSRIKEAPMPVFSYLAYPVQGAKEQLRKDLAALDCCDVMPSDNAEVLVLVTDTPDEDIEKNLKRALGQIESLQSLGMTFGHVDQ
jgi:nitrate reductase NapAB chaperone NapD